ncbi:MAG: WXG100 family type VII secretion target [Anaerolineae bacterium]|nr:WXG100 family type VII secretion target [Anaerolineae bacterium]
MKKLSNISIAEKLNPFSKGDIMTDIRVDYQALSDISTQLRSLCGQLETAYRAADIKAIELREDGWLGEGADAFYQEWFDVFFPRLKRLMTAILETSLSIDKISETFQEAEDSASGQFKDHFSPISGAQLGNQNGLYTQGESGRPPSVAVDPNRTNHSPGREGEASAGRGPGVINPEHSPSSEASAGRGPGVINPEHSPSSEARPGGRLEQGEANEGSGPGSEIKPEYSADGGIKGQPELTPDFGTKDNNFPGDGPKTQPLTPDFGTKDNNFPGGGPKGQPELTPDFGTKDNNFPGDGPKTQPLTPDFGTKDNNFPGGGPKGQPELTPDFGTKDNNFPGDGPKTQPELTFDPKAWGQAFIEGRNDAIPLTPDGKTNEATPGSPLEPGKPR